MEFEDFPTYREIVYREEKDVAFIEFEFYNGAMSTEDCERLFAGHKVRQAKACKGHSFAGW